MVEIAPDAQPPVARIIDYKKFKYSQEKKERQARKHTKETELKEVRFSPFIGEHDFQTAIDKVKRFLKEGNLVKVSVVFKGRQMAHQEFGPKMLAKIMSSLEGIVKEERQARFEGRRYVTLIRTGKPLRDKAQQQTNKDESKNQESSSQTL